MKRQIMGREVVVAITDGRLDLGTWEQIFYGEFDGRRRKRRVDQGYRRLNGIQEAVSRCRGVLGEHPGDSPLSALNSLIYHMLHILRKNTCNLKGDQVTSVHPFNTGGIF